MCRNRKKEPAQTMPTEAVIKLTNARIQEVIGHFYRYRVILVRGREGGKGNLVTYAEVLAAFQKAIDLEQTRLNHEGIIKQLETLLENAQTELTDLRAMVGRVEGAAGLSVDSG
jgi:hypothetical protein